jgi:single-strand DNA-binding protein
MNEASLQLTGNLTTDPELRYTPSGRAVANLRVAANPRRYDRQSGQWVDGQTNYFDVAVWAGPENVAESLSRGDRVIIFGNLRTQTWTPEGADKARSKLVVVATAIGPDLRYATAKPVKTARVEDAPDTEEEPF